MKWSLPAVVLGIMIPLGCADGALLASRPADDPSSPSAPAGDAYRVGFASAGDAPPTHAEVPADDVVYTCVMHPEILRDAPGACPKCGMTLVPAAHPHQHGGTP